MSWLNFPGNSVPLALLDPVNAANTAAATGSAIDLLPYEGPVAVVQSHGAGTGTLVGKLQDSDDGASGWADTGHVFVSEGTSPGVQVVTLQSKQVRRFVRYVGTITTGPHQVAVSALAIRKGV